MNKCTKMGAFLTAVSIITALVFIPCNAQSANKTSDANIGESVETETVDYEAYLESNTSASVPQSTIEAERQIPDNARTDMAEGETGALLSSSQKQLDYTFNVSSSGNYKVHVRYYTLEGKSKDVSFALNVDGMLPFEEASSVSLSRIYTDSGEIVQDQNGNDLRPAQIEVFRWNEIDLQNTNGYYNDPYFIHFETGIHTVSFIHAEESMLISCVTLVPSTEIMSYNEYSKGATMAESYIKLYEAEESFEKSSSMLYPTYDRSSASTSPSHYSKMRYNTIGQSNWSHQGQWISWKITVPTDGWYSISMRARQNYQQGINSYRTLYVDGKIPFKEVQNIEFPYQLNWYLKTLADKNNTPYLFYLTSGTHELRMEVAAGPMGEVLKSLNDSVLELNSIYRSIIMVTGTSPDQYRTYYLEETIPTLFDNLKAVGTQLDTIYSQISDITGAYGSQASTIKEMSVMIEEFLKKPLNIPARIAAFKDNIESLGSLILTLGEQAMELDYLVVSSDTELPRVNAGFIEGLVYGIKGFMASFVEDYNSIGSAGENGETTSNIIVWISNGRDQAQILKNLIDNKFTPKTDIGVTMSIVSTASGTASSTLVQATLAGKGPDVALFTPKDTPVNLAMRGALTDISQLEGYDELNNQFFPSAWIPYEYENGVYGVPETQNYDMLFYREDIFNQLGLSIPQTWDELYSTIELLQKNNLGIGIMETNSLNAGISSGISFFEKILLQNGGKYYNDNLTATGFDSEIAYQAFSDWTQLYTHYGLDRSFDFFNRFRSGEMPIGIMPYTSYNQLYAAAPEIRGLWSMTLIPGTKREDGSIDRTETASGTAAIMLNDCKVKKEAWEFIKWWVSSQTQAGYGTELEASLGVAARYDTANITAFESISWTQSEAEIIKKQWEHVTDIKQIPGNYFISRCLTNAFRTVVDENVNPVRALNTYNKDMNTEIIRKRAEFGLD